MKPPLAAADVLIALAERTAEVDRIVTDAAAELLFPVVPSGLTVLAVGGYGRRHLFPYSDVDLLLLFENERGAGECKDAISAFLRRLWDSSLRVSHSVRTPAECAEVHDGNTELNISLLDQRYLTGDRALYGQLAERLPRFIQASRASLIRNLAQLTRERHAKYAGTFYHLEPNVKDTPGGLRDYQLLCWLEQMRETTATRVGHAAPGEELDAAFRFLSRLRYRLHTAAGRDSNILSFDAQDMIAEEWRNGDVARGMRDYYRQARTVYRAAIRALEAAESQSSGLFGQFRDWRARLSNADFSVHRERVHFRAPQRIAVEPEILLSLFEFVGRHGIALSTEAEQQIAARLPQIKEYFSVSRPIWGTVENILSLPHAPLALRAMHEAEFLTALFPELEVMECLVVRDFFHRYTVDEHTLVAIGLLWKLRGNGGTARTMYSSIFAEVRTPATLVFALLFHDAGKAIPGESHVITSQRLAEPAMRRLQMPSAQQEDVLFLIRCHLEISAAMQKRDIFDPNTASTVAHRVETVERLKMLTLLTWADIGAVNPNTMTPWRADQLWQLYLMVYNELTRELDGERIEVLPSGPPERTAFLAGFPTRYLRTHTEQEVTAHMELEERSRELGFAVEIRRLDSAWELTLVAADRPGLFANVAGALSSFGLNILRAEAFSNKLGLILDTFSFSDPLRTLTLNPSEVDRLRLTVERVLAGKTDAGQLLRHRPKPRLPSRRARVAPRVAFNSHASQSATLVEITAQDRPGLLHDLAAAISAHGCNIAVVLIDTRAHKAIDVFYVTRDGRKLDEAEQNTLGDILRAACSPG